MPRCHNLRAEWRYVASSLTATGQAYHVRLDGAIVRRQRRGVTNGWIAISSKGEPILDGETEMFFKQADDAKAALVRSTVRI